MVSLIWGLHSPFGLPQFSTLLVRTEQLPFAQDFLLFWLARKYHCEQHILKWRPLRLREALSTLPVKCLWCLMCELYADFNRSLLVTNIGTLE